MEDKATGVDEGALVRLVHDEAAWQALVSHLNLAHARMKALMSLPLDRAPPDLSAQLQKVRAEVDDAEQAILSFIAVRRAARQQQTTS